MSVQVLTAPSGTCCVGRCPVLIVTVTGHARFGDIRRIVGEALAAKLNASVSTAPTVGARDHGDRLGCAGTAGGTVLLVGGQWVSTPAAPR